MFYIQLKAIESNTTKYPLCITSNSNESNFYESTPTIITTSEHRSTSRKASDTTSDILHYATLTGKENNVNEENEVQSPLCLQLIISETNCKEIKQGQLYKDKQTLKTVMHFYAISKNFKLFYHIWIVITFSNLSQHLQLRTSWNSSWVGSEK